MIKDNIIKKIIKNSGIIFFGNSMASAINIASFAIMANAIGPEYLAVFVLAQTYSLLVNDIFNIQTWESMVKFGTVKHGNSEFSNVVKTNVVLDGLSAFVAFLFSLLFIYPVFILLGWDLSNLYIIGLYTVSILFNLTSLTIGIPRLFDKFGGIAKIQVTMSVIRISSIALAYYYKKEFTFYIIAYLIVEIMTNLSLTIYSLILLKLKLGRGWWQRKMTMNKEQIRFIWWTNLRTIIRIPVRRFDVIVISSVMSLQMLGFYKVYKEVTSVISRIGDPVNQSIFPEFTKLIGDNKAGQSVKVAMKTILLMSSLSIVLTLGLLITAEFIIGTFFGNEYLEYIYALYMMVIVSGISFAISPINSLFIAAGFAKLSFYIVVFTNTVYLLVAFGCGTIWGIFGVVLANAVQMVLNQSLKIIIMKKNSTGWTSAIR